MDANQVSIPGPEANDSKEVQEALRAAGTLWSEDPKQALRWLRKAAETASDSGDVMRSVHLARAAADLRDLANIQGSLPPPASGAPPAGALGTPAFQAAASVSQHPGQTVPATPAAAAAAALQQASYAAQAGREGNGAGHDAAAQQAAQAAQHAAAEAAAQQAAARQAAAHHIEAQQTAAQTAAAQQAAAEVAAGQQAAEEAAAQQADATQQTEDAASADVGITQPAHPVSSPPSAPHFVTHRAVRVAISPAPTGPGQFTVHPLGEGESAEPGWKEALLVGLEPGERIFPGRE